MPTDLDAYRQALLDLYRRLPDTPRHLSRFDLRLVRQLWERRVPLPVVEMAFWLASARRAARPAHALRLGPIRSLHYFLPVIEELLVHPLPENYAAYLRSKVASHPSSQSHTHRYGLTLNSPNRPLFKFIHFEMRADMIARSDIKGPVNRIRTPVILSWGHAREGALNPARGLRREKS